MTNARSLVSGQLAKFAARFLSPQNKLTVSQTDIASPSRRPFTLTMLVTGVVVIAMTCLPVTAQVRFGTVLGTILDSSGATVSGANVKLTNVGTSETRTAR